MSRSADPNDRRAKIVQVTQKAAPLLTALKDVGEEVDAVTRGDMSLEDWTSLQSMLQKVRQTQLTAYRSRRTAEDTPE